MASYDRKFEVVYPLLGRLTKKPLEVADTGLLNPVGTSPVPLIDGELVAHNASYKWIRATNAAQPSFFVIEDRGDAGVQASRKLSAIIGGGAFECDTIVYDVGLTTLGAGVGLGVVNNSLSGSVNRSGLVAVGGNLALGYITRVASSSTNSLLRILQTLV